MTVEPIRDKRRIKQMYCLLKGKDPKYALLFKFGLNTGLRISDIITLKVKDIYKSNETFHEYLVLKEKKTGKEKKIMLNNSIRNELKTYIRLNRLNPDDYLFPSQKGGYVGRIQVYRVFKEVSEIVGIENFGTHSLRKSWGYWTYKISRYNIGLIMDTFNHSSQSITLRYIGVNQDQKDELYSMVQF